MLMFILQILNLNMNKNLSIEKIFGSAINYHQQKDLFNAELNYIKILEIDPFHIGSLNNLGLILINKKKFKESIILFKKIIDKEPNYKRINKYILNYDNK